MPNPRDALCDDRRRPLRCPLRRSVIGKCGSFSACSPAHGPSCVSDAALGSIVDCLGARAAGGPAQQSVSPFFIV